MKRNAAGTPVRSSQGKQPKAATKQAAQSSPPKLSKAVAKQAPQKKAEEAAKKKAKQKALEEQEAKIAAAAEARRKKAEEEEKTRRAAAAAAAAEAKKRKQAEEAEKARRAAIEAAEAAKRRQAEEAEKARRAAIAAAEAEKKRQEELAIARKEAEKVVETAHTQANAAHVAAQKRLMDEEQRGRIVEEAATKQSTAEEVAAAAQAAAAEAVAVAKNLAEEAVAAQKLADQASAAADEAKRKADEQEHIALRHTMEAATAKQHAEEEATKAASQKRAQEEEARKLVEEESLIIDQIKGFCKKFDLKIAGDSVEVLQILKNYLGDVAAEAAAKKKKEEEAAAQKLAEEEAAKKKKQEEEEAVQKLAEEAARKKQEDDEAARKLAEEEEAAAKKRKQEEDAQRKLAEEEAATKKEAVEAAKKLAEAEEAAKKKNEEAEAAKRLAEEAARKKNEEEEAAKRLAEEAARKKSEEEEAARKSAQEESARKKNDEEAVRNSAEEEAAKAKTGAELPRKLADEAAAKQQSEARQSPVQAEAVEYRHTCHRGHQLKSGNAFGNTCDVCGRERIFHETIYRCSTCNWDMCNACSSAKAQHAAQKEMERATKVARFDEQGVAVTQARQQDVHKTQETLEPALKLAASTEAPETQEIERATKVARVDEQRFATMQAGQQDEPKPQDTGDITLKLAIPQETLQKQADMPQASRGCDGDHSGPQDNEPKSQPARAKGPVVLVVEDGKFRLECKLVDANYAEERHQELRAALVSKRGMVETKVAYVQNAAADHASAVARVGAIEEAEKVKMKSAEDALRHANRNVDACASEAANVQLMHKTFEEVRQSFSDKAKAAALSYKQQLGNFGIEKSVIDSLPAMLVKKKLPQKDKKTLTCIEDKLVKHTQARKSMVDKCKVEVQRCEEVFKKLEQASQMRARELSKYEEAWQATERDRKASEEDVCTAIRELSEHEAQMTREGFMRFSSSRQSCNICCDEVGEDGSVLLGCGHGWYCKDCVTRFVEARLDGGTAGDIPCPDCSAAISEKDLINILPKKLIFRLHARSMEQRAVVSGATLRPCPTPNCSMRKILEDESSARQTCPMCRQESCWLCGTQPYHEGLTCEEHSKNCKEDESFLEWMQATGTKQCPTCRMATSKENLQLQNQQRSECHKMQCRNCGTKFCFKCLALLTESFSCKCSDSRHGFIDPHTGKWQQHLRRGKAKAKPTAEATALRNLN